MLISWVCKCHKITSGASVGSARPANFGCSASQRCCAIGTGECAAASHTVGPRFSHAPASLEHDGFLRSEVLAGSDDRPVPFLFRSGNLKKITVYGLASML